MELLRRESEGSIETLLTKQKGERVRFASFNSKVNKMFVLIFAVPLLGRKNKNKNDKFIPLDSVYDSNQAEKEGGLGFFFAYKSGLIVIGPTMSGWMVYPAKLFGEKEEATAVELSCRLLNPQSMLSIPGPQGASFVF